MWWCPSEILGLRCGTYHICVLLYRSEPNCHPREPDGSTRSRPAAKLRVLVVLSYALSHSGINLPCVRASTIGINLRTSWGA